jgi:hypothetical protein
MGRVVFQHMISLFERAKAVHALDRSGPVIGVMHTNTHAVHIEVSAHNKLRGP